MIAVVPTKEPGRGGGHLVRCTKLVNELQALGKDAVLYESADYTDLHGLNIELVILDRFQTPADELEKWKELAPTRRAPCVIGIDEGGESRDKFDFLIDILPNLEKVRPNITDIGLLPLPKDLAQRRRDAEKAEKNCKVLISFGLEDNAGLGQAVFDSLSKKKNNNLEITFLNAENRIDNLSEHLHEYDLIITHFGITAFEATYSGTPVLLINPTAYHEKLARKAGFQTTTINKITSALSAPEPKVRLRIRARNIKPNSLAKLIASFSPQINRACPVCGAKPPKRALARFSDRTYRKCAECGIIFMDRLTQAPVAYGKEYFFEEYKKQYGKTYLEDFPNLVAIARKRLRRIKGTKGNEGWRINFRTKRASVPSVPSSSSLLDIGCAYGAFLSAAKEGGYDAHGIDPSEDAVRYVKDTLDIQATHGFFPIPQGFKPATCCLLPAACDVITLWYTIEHFNNCVPVLKEIYSLLAPNGILAFSAPSFSGISGRANLRKFLQNSPADHFTIWSPTACKKALALHGFKVKKIVNSGHHPERFPVLGKLACCKLSPFYWLLMSISKVFRLGDTFEVYAVKKKMIKD